MLDKVTTAGSDQEVLTTPEAWSAFIEGELRATCEAYLAKPAFLIGHARTEQQTTADYAGRELLELVQNAADAATEIGGAGRVLIEVTHDALFVANTGQPFRKGGVTALMTAHTSDKPSRAARMIGAKGLGFRAILNWTEAPVISSGALEIGFSRTHALARVAELASLDSTIANHFSDASTEQPPLLVFPATGPVLETLADHKVRAMLRHTRSLRENGFDTVVAAPFRDSKTFQRAIAQASQFEPSFLLFVTALDSIQIRLPDQSERHWSKKIEGNGDVSLALHNGLDAAIQNWILRQKTGAVGSGDNARDYELAIALRLDEANKPGLLHSFFPTSLPLPFHGLFHATLELDSSRKTIKDDSELNTEVLAALGRFHAEVLYELRLRNRVKNPLAWLQAHQEFPAAITKVGLAAWSRAQQLPLIRCMDGEWRTASEARIGPPGYAAFLPQRLFGELAETNGGRLESVLRHNLKVEAVDPQQILVKLREGDLNLAERARAIVGIAKALPEDHHDRRLLLDIKGTVMPSTATAFPPPVDEGKRLGLPNWANARFIHPELWAELLTATPGNTVREKIHALRGFRVVEYSADTVIAALRGRVGELLKKNKSNPDRLHAEFLATVYTLHDRTRNRPAGLFRVRCKDGTWQDITMVHLSELYSQSGRINASLYAGHPQALIGTPAENGFGEATDDLAEFLTWLGINPWPRKVTEALPEKWQRTVIDALPEKFMVFDGNKSQELRRADLRWNHTIRAEHDTIFALKEILEAAPCDAILAWIAHDPRLDPLAPVPAFRVRAEGRSSGFAAFRPYQGSLPDILRMTLQSGLWLECHDNQRQAPQDAMIEPGVLAALFHVPRAVNPASEAEFGLTRAHWRRGLERAGVVRNLDDLPEAQVYRLLLSLPSRNVRPDVASKLFLQILEREAFEPDLGGPDRAAFFAHGQLPVQSSEGRVWSEREGVFYAHRDDLPSAARAHLTLIDLPSRRNAKQVAARFGVRPLHKESLEIRTRTLEELHGPDAVMLKDRFSSAKPYISALRRALSPEGAHLRRLESTELQVARRAEVEMHINGNRVVEELDPWKHSLVDGNLMITLDSSRSFNEVLDLGLHTIADGLAELFELQSGADFVPFLTASSEILRQSHLRRALPWQSDEELAALIRGSDAQYASPFAPEVDAATLAAGPAVASNNNRRDEIGPSSHSDERRIQKLSVNLAKAGDPTLELSVQPREAQHTLSPAESPATKRTLRVAGPTGQLSSKSHNLDLDRAADAEHWTAAFERTSGRFPELVAHLQGTLAFGCDYLSFDTEADRTAFRADPTRIDLVSRFIETKSGSVRFTDNEWAAASKLGERYFIYRLSFTPGKREYAQLTIVRNPLACAEAIRTERELLIERAIGREEFDLLSVASSPHVQPEKVAGSPTALGLREVDLLPSPEI